LVLANAAHVKNVPGRKTDVNDAMWPAELLAHGLIRASFVPDAQTQEMRNLLRTRMQARQSSKIREIGEAVIAALCRLTHRQGCSDYRHNIFPRTMPPNPQESLLTVTLLPFQTFDFGWLTGNPDVGANNICACAAIAGPAFISPADASSVVVTIVENVPFNFGDWRFRFGCLLS
jgi:hypothetical protein